LKGVYDEQEITEIKQPIQLVEVIKLEVPELVGERHLVVLKKP
ncbi:TPA: 16S rRNA (guanine(527)-N(7))-methyltransferase RsmG, partial [Mannheimia haemolytica]|nr:16S rRNA (guanine(527)-N(7))-methyltransferase RsmG [Mannheimia haemolytica]